ncbi:methionyl-tRNA synthetase, partial [Chytridiales sp. JEL 0842]
MPCWKRVAIQASRLPVKVPTCIRGRNPRSSLYCATIPAQCHPRSLTTSSHSPGTSTSTASSHKPLLITSPIFYVNASPHIGHLFTATIADVLRRWYEFKGLKTQYSIGTDEHGLKIQEAARLEKREPKEFCDEISARFKTLFDEADISYTDYIRTTDPRHYEAISALWTRLVEKGYIYKGKHEGWYSVSDETFYPATQVKTVTDAKGNQKAVSIETGKVVEWTTEENYKFRLGMVRERLVEWLQENPDVIIPQAQYKNVLTALTTNASETLTDLSVSRPKARLQWGIPVPGDPEHVIYVWLDALTNYLTVSGYPWKTDADFRQSSWPAQWHVVGKDIIKFHAIYWPAFLLAADLPLPRRILSHAHWLSGKTKMSKSLGNVTDPHLLISKFGVDPVRYFLVRDGGIEHDADFSMEGVHKRYKELGNQLGNLVMRCSSEKINRDLLVPGTPGKGGMGVDEQRLVELLEGVT